MLQKESKMMCLPCACGGLRFFRANLRTSRKNDGAYQNCPIRSGVKRYFAFHLVYWVLWPCENQILSQEGLPNRRQMAICSVFKGLHYTILASKTFKRRLDVAKRFENDVTTLCLWESAFFRPNLRKS